ncbi:hypothetical protein [Nocardiopsis algeriensis]|uniref:Uncharacterized protein n=1 Tax=Nocardiopsis algeriensis TaxID=1478215 RepID=A0A841INV0_9ACTN|nr:hypothetical protein [Nocardiopsis algeriensis]MBB6120343.1 hypothetical protein [Nocardiopsis algeriensis]
MRWWLRARLVLPGLVLLAAAWAAGLASADQLFAFPTVFGPRAHVPVALLAATAGLLLTTYGLDRSRTPVELTANRPVLLWDAALVAGTALAAVTAGLTACFSGIPEGLMMARTTVAGLGVYLVARAVVRTDLAGLAPMGMLTANIVLWDVQAFPVAGPWLLAAPGSAVSWWVSVLVLVLGLGCLLSRFPTRN